MRSPVDPIDCSDVYSLISKAERLIRIKKATKAVFDAMIFFPDDEDIQYQSCFAIGTFARLGGVDMLNLLQKYQCAALLIKSLEKFATNKRILWTCCVAIMRVAESSRGNLRKLRKLKAAKVCKNLFMNVER